MGLAARLRCGLPLKVEALVVVAAAAHVLVDDPPT